MKILAIEFSSAQRSVAVADAGATAGFVVRAEMRERGLAATPAFALIEQALRESRTEREEIETLAVGLGPGSFTGIRIALAVAQGWRLARAVKTAGVSSVDCLAQQAHALARNGRLTFALNAQRREFYLATYEFHTGAPRCVEALHIVSEAELAERSARGEALAGPDLPAKFAATLLFPEAGILAKLAAERGLYQPPEQLEPIYLREVSFVKAPPARNRAER